MKSKGQSYLLFNVRKNLKYFLSGILFSVIFIFTPYQTLQWIKELPSPKTLEQAKIPKPTQIFDRNGILLYELYIDKESQPVALTELPKHILNATIAAEDGNFYKHAGFDLPSILRAARKVIFEKKLEGGSTITQQLVKNSLLTPERTWSRKIKELVLSIFVEMEYSKDEILEMYLNNTPYGGNAWGIQSAARHYFNKDAQNLTLAESSFLAGLTSAPSLYSPALTGDLKAAKERQKYVLNRMLALNFVNEEEKEAALNDDLHLTYTNEYIKAPHFVFLIKKQLEEMYGQKYVNYAGLRVITTLDAALQEKTETIVKDEVLKSEKYLISNGAALVMEPQSAEVLAYVGSVDYFKDTWGAYDIIQGYRQPGSSIKPLIYALALEEGYTAASILKDTPAVFNVTGQKPYTPKNYDRKYRGDVTIRTALANSLNIPAVRLAQRIGPEEIVKFGIKMGLTNWKLDKNYGLSIALGGKEVRLFDLTNMYGTFARSGVYKKQKTILSVLDSNGHEIFVENNQETNIVSKETAYLIWHILSDNNARKQAFGSNNQLEIKSHTVAVKTGTTDQIKDNYTIGFTPNYVVGVWVGNNDNKPLHRTLASGVTGAAPIWNRIMTDLLLNEKNTPMEKPTNIIDKKFECGKTEVFDKTKKIPDICKIETDKKE